MITVGVLFAADRFTDYHFHQTWPVLLIVILALMQLLAGRRRRPDYYPPPRQARPPHPRRFIRLPRPRRRSPPPPDIAVRDESPGVTPHEIPIDYRPADSGDYRRCFLCSNNLGHDIPLLELPDRITGRFF